MLNSKNRVPMTVMGLIGVVALVLGVYVSQHIHLKKELDVSQFHGTVLEKPREVNAFALMGIDHSPFTNHTLEGHWTMVFFGFTSCGAICPTTMAELSKMYKLLNERGVKTLPQVVMVSVDPERDSLEKLGQYVKAFNPHFYGASGDESTINQMTKELGVAYAKIAPQGNQDSQNYDIEHTGTVMMFNPRGELSAFFTMPHQASLLAEDYQRLVS